jgi:hypothetical protein
MTGSFVPIRHVETLNAPQTVAGWNKDGLLLASGSLVPVPGLRNLPATSKALAEATKRGIEIQPAGNVVVLVRMWHWCGNDPVREDIQRVDLSDMLTFMKVGDPDKPPPNANLLPDDPESTIDETWGWRVEQLSDFRSWCAMKANP